MQLPVGIKFLTYMCELGQYNIMRSGDMVDGKKHSLPNGILI